MWRRHNRGSEGSRVMGSQIESKKKPTSVIWAPDLTQLVLNLYNRREDVALVKIYR